MRHPLPPTCTMISYKITILFCNTFPYVVCQRFYHLFFSKTYCHLLLLLSGASKPSENINKIEKLDCVVHRARGMRRRFYATQWSEYLSGHPSHASYTYRKNKLCDALVTRCVAELQHGISTYSNLEKLQAAMKKAAKNIIDCFMGNHAHCRTDSMVCHGASKVQSPPNHLPYSSYIHPTEEDKKNLMLVINHLLGEERVTAMRTGLSTNKVENLHLRTLKVLPKTKTVKKNYKGRNHSAMHSDSMSTPASMIMANRTRGAPIKSKAAFNFLKSAYYRDKYHKNFKRTNTFRASRKQSRWHLLNLKKFSRLNIN